MDIKVYKKEEVKQPQGTEYFITPNIIDIIPLLVEDEEGNEVLVGAEEIESYEDIVEQQTALATIWQFGLDPVNLNYGIQWSESVLGEVSALQLMEQIRQAVAEVTLSVEVVFSVVTDEYGNEYLKYTLQGVA